MQGTSTRYRAMQFFICDIYVEMIYLNLQRYGDAMLVRIQMGTNTAENQQQHLSLILLRNREFISQGTNNQ